MIPFLTIGMTKEEKSLFLDVADTYARIAHGTEKMGQLEAASGEKEFGRFLGKVTDIFEKLKKVEARVGTDEELKEVDTLRYFTRETQAAKVGSIFNYELMFEANKILISFGLKLI